MKMCDRCGQRDEQYKEVGGLSVQITGYHHEHHTHRGKPWRWGIDLCPICAGKLKDSLDALVNSYKVK